MTTTHFVWDRLSDNVLAEYDDAGDPIAQYTNEPGQFGKLVSQRRDGKTSTYHFDGVDNTRQLTDENQNVTDEYTYSAFGEEVAKTGTTVNPFGFQGAVGYYVAGTDTLYDRDRWYDIETARWESKRRGASRYMANRVYTFQNPGQAAAPPPKTVPMYSCCEWCRVCTPLAVSYVCGYRPWTECVSSFNPKKLPLKLVVCHANVVNGKATINPVACCNSHAPSNWNYQCYNYLTNRATRDCLGAGPFKNGNCDKLMASWISKAPDNWGSQGWDDCAEWCQSCVARLPTKARPIAGSPQALLTKICIDSICNNAFS